MYNTRKVCLECNFTLTYDSNRDIHTYREYKYCPKCKAVLAVNPYCPNL